MKQANVVIDSLPRHPPQLTPRELQVLKLTWMGMTRPMIAGELGISMRTVEAHRQSMAKKLGVRNVQELLHVAIRDGWVK